LKKQLISIHTILQSKATSPQSTISTHSKRSTAPSSPAALPYPILHCPARDSLRSAHTQEEEEEEEEEIKSLLLFFFVHAHHHLIQIKKKKP
jgi:hypothetical protein